MAADIELASHTSGPGATSGGPPPPPLPPLSMRRTRIRGWRADGRLCHAEEEGGRRAGVVVFKRQAPEKPGRGGGGEMTRNGGMKVIRGEEQPPG